MSAFFVRYIVFLLYKIDMNRIAYQKLLDWKNKSNRLPLIIQGARQVGKTWLMKEFGRNEYEHTAYFNFESSIELHNIFKSGFNISRIIKSLEILNGNEINPDNTLIIFDEIQSCPEALTSLKYFQENAPNFHVFAAGSLLGVAMHQGVSFPVGIVHLFTLYPLTFHEYLQAINENALLMAIIQNDHEILKSFHGILTEHFKKYLYVGGMPAVVNKFASNSDLLSVRELQLQILASYENDFSKHAPISQLPRIRMIWQSIVSQLAKENSKFIYSLIRKGSRAKEFELAIEWLSNAGLIHKVNRINKSGMPITAYADWNDFKLYLHDVGLLGALANLPPNVILEGNHVFEEFKGVLSEQFICQQIVSQSLQPFYWSPDEGRSEVDFIIQKSDQIIPIEVKSSENLKSRSLRVYYDKYLPKECIRTSLSPYILQDWMKNIPMYSFQQWVISNPYEYEEGRIL
jgi:predicted AAA+ superfamily ATPase